jgi:hypothetical protein
MPGMDVTFRDASALLQDLLRSGARQDIIKGISGPKKTASTLACMRDSFRSQMFKAGTRQFDLNPIVRSFDSQVAGKGFHVLHDWDGKANVLREDLISVELITYFMELPTTAYPLPLALGMLLDYHLLYILAVLAVNAWCEGDPNENLDRITELAGDLQGPEGSGHHFVANAETLILNATSHYEPDEDAYRRLLEKVRRLSPVHQRRIARAHAAILGSHLRHGFQDLYMRDFAIMRGDNGPDYPWLFFSVDTLMRRYAELSDQGIHGNEREIVVEGLINGLSADVRALIGKPPAALLPYQREHAEFCALFYRYRPGLLQEFESHRPSDQAYSPLAFNFNFPHNAIKGLVATSIVRGRPAPLPVNDLLTAIPCTPELDTWRRTLALDLTKAARLSPDIIRGRPVPIFSYDPYRARRDFAKTIGTITESVRP